MTLASALPALPAAMLVLAFAGPLSAQTTDVQIQSVDEENQEEPVEVTSNQLTVDQNAGSAVFTGDVVVVQGEIRINAPQMVVQYIIEPDGTVGTEVDTITATGGVLMVTPSEEAEADQAVYTLARDEVVMAGNVLLTQGPNTINGTRMVWDVTTGAGQMEGRVRTILQPGSEQQ